MSARPGWDHTPCPRVESQPGALGRVLALEDPGARKDGASRMFLPEFQRRSPRRVEQIPPGETLKSLSWSRLCFNNDF